MKYLSFLLLKHGLATGSLFTIYDIGGQLIQQGKHTNSLEWQRCARCFALGFVAGPTIRTWFKYLAKKYPMEKGGKHYLIGEKIIMESGLSNIARKTVVDQVFFFPLYLASLMIGHGILKGKSYVDIIQDLKNDYFMLWGVGVMNNVILQPFGFYLVPVETMAVLFVMIYPKYYSGLFNALNEEYDSPERFYTGQLHDN